jgi:hypothetical protein
MSTINDLLNEIDHGYTLVVYEVENGEYAVWVNYGSKTSTAPYEGVTRAELDAVIARHPDKVVVRDPT